MIANKAFNKRLHIQPKIALLIKLVAIFGLFVFTNASFAYDDDNLANTEAEAKTIQAQHQKMSHEQMSHEQMSHEQMSHDSHEDCDGECCDKQCHCTIAPCASVWIMLSNEKPLYLKSYNSFYPFVRLYKFSPPSSLNRPPILS